MTLEGLANQIDDQQVIIVDMHSEFVPPELKDWNEFIACYNTRKGTLVKFEKINEEQWKLVNEKKKQKWTVGQWYEVRVRSFMVLILIFLLSLLVVRARTQ